MMIRAAAARRSFECVSTHWILLVAVVGLFACRLFPRARGADVNLDDAATAETSDEVARSVRKGGLSIPRLSSFPCAVNARLNFLQLKPSGC